MGTATYRTETPPRKLISVLDYGAATLLSFLERYRTAALVLASIAYLAVTAGISAWRPFWYDELFTHYIARRPVEEIRRALQFGTDQLPLTYYLAVRACQHLFGANEFAARIPSILGYWLGCLCVFWFVRRRTAAVYGFIAMAFVLSSSFAYRYAYEARPYALTFGFAALALLCWQNGTETRRRPAAVIGLAVALLGAVSSHYYGILLVCPIAVGELVRWLSNRRIDWPVWFALLPCFTPLAWANLGTNISKYSANFWSAPKPSFFILFYERTLESLLLPGTFLLAVVALFYVVREDDSPPGGLAQRPPVHEVAAVAALAALPVFGYAVAVFVTNALVPRYVLPAVLGVAVLFAWLAFFGPQGQKFIGAAALVVLAGAAGMNRVLEFRSMARERAQAPGLALPVSVVRGAGPVVIENPLFFFEASSRSPIRSRLFYLVDPKSAARYPSTYLDPGLPLLKDLAGVNVEEFDDFTGKYKQFLVYERHDASYGEGWIVTHLLNRGARLELKEVRGSESVYAVALSD